MLHFRNFQTSIVAPLPFENLRAIYAGAEGSERLMYLGDRIGSLGIQIRNSGQVNLKPIMLFFLIGSIICLSHLSREILFKLKCKLDSRRWNDIVRSWSKP